MASAETPDNSTEHLVAFAKSENRVTDLRDATLHTSNSPPADDISKLEQETRASVHSDNTKNLSSTQYPQNSYPSSDSTDSMPDNDQNSTELIPAQKPPLSDGDNSQQAVFHDNPDIAADRETVSESVSSSEDVQNSELGLNKTSHENVEDYEKTHLPDHVETDSSAKVDHHLEEQQQQEQQQQGEQQQQQQGEQQQGEQQQQLQGEQQQQQEGEQQQQQQEGEQQQQQQQGEQQQQQQQKQGRRMSDARGRRESVDECRSYSTEDETSDWETPVDVELEVSHTAALVKRPGRVSWSAVRAVTTLMTNKASLPWSQLAGHKGSFLAGPEGTVLKLRDPCEEKNLCRLQEEGGQLYHQFMPQFYGAVKRNGKDYVQLQNLQSGFSSPSVMDVKMGLRTYLCKDMLKAEKEPTLRKDLYEKLVSVDPEAPTVEERRRQKVSKTRYLQFRDDSSSSSSLGFRIEGIKTPSIASKDYKKTNTPEDVQKALSAFIGDNTTALEKYMSLLQNLQQEQESSPFFHSHEIVGSSLLFIHDSSGKTGVWMIDFAKCCSLPAKVTVDHRSQWLPGSYEDGYWLGLDNLRSLFQRIETAKLKEK